ncbi:MAG: lysophospholipid acyltransferase family protein [Planctomycetes bacterium]|nr:lysophospholipid acyltransferase family protein [Planctomycetota bacterium]
MSKARSRLADYAVYLLVRVFVCIIQVLSWESARQFARGLAWLLYKVDHRHRLVAGENLRHAFGEQLDERQRDAMVRAVYVHFCTMLVELIQLPRKFHIHNWKQYGRLYGGDKVVAGLLSDRSLLIVTGHLGNWEIAGYALGVFGFKTYAIARTLDNPYLDHFLLSFRERTGQKVLAKKGDFDQIQELLAGSGAIATLADQDAGQRGLFVDFFGRPASTHKAVALLALEYNTPLVVIGVPRLGEAEFNGFQFEEPARYRIILSDYIDPEEYKGRPDAVKAITQRYTTALERVIRLAPEQYFWLHRRWKHQPAPKKRKKAA